MLEAMMMKRRIITWPSKALLDQLFASRGPNEVFARDGPLGDPKKALSERIPENRARGAS
jgi:hypothetical protein